MAASHKCRPLINNGKERIESTCNATYLRRLFVDGDLTAILNYSPFYPSNPPKPKRFRVNEVASLQWEAGAAGEVEMNSGTRVAPADTIEHAIG
jgi:hypothetical protein